MRGLLFVWFTNVVATIARVLRYHSLNYVVGPVLWAARGVSRIASDQLNLLAGPATSWRRDWDTRASIRGFVMTRAARLEMAMRAALAGWFGDMRVSAKNLRRGLTMTGGIELLLQLVGGRRAATACALGLLALCSHGTAAYGMAGIRYLESYAQMQALAVTPAADAGIRRFVDLDNGLATRYIQIRMAATVQIAGAVATNLRNLGLVEALWDEMGIVEAGSPVIAADPRGLSYASERVLARGFTRKDRVTSTAIATTNLGGEFRLWFENPNAVIPAETLFLEKQVNQKLQAFFRYSTATTGAGASTVGAGRLMNAPVGATVTITNVTIRVQQLADNTVTQDSLPLFRPRVDQVNFQPVGVNPRLQIPIPVDTNEYLRGLTIIFDTNEGIDVGNADVTELGLKGDRFQYISRGALVTINDFDRGQSYESGGELASLYNGACIYIDFQKAGRLSNLYSPGQDSNLMLQLNVAVLPAGLNVIIQKHSLIRDTWQDPATKRRIIAETLPNELAQAVAA